MKKIAIFGSTGSIGTQAIDIICKNKDKFKVTSLACNNNTEVLLKQIDLLDPEVVFVGNEDKAIDVKRIYPKLKVITSLDELDDLAENGSHHMLLNSLVGIAGLRPTIAAIRGRKEIALANKESLVTGGSFLMNMAKEYGVEIIPVDSEHSAIFQSLCGNKKSQLAKIILTASGGPFRGKTIEELKEVSVEDALKHPNWSMGNKITIDSATLMNKGLEVIEAAVLFDLKPSQIEVVVHPQSILHSAVEYVDGSIIGQLGRPDMRVPISYALSYPDRTELKDKSLDFFSEASNLTFERVNREVFKTIDLALYALENGTSHQIVLNAANEVLVQLFLDKKIKFLDIQKYIDLILKQHQSVDITDVGMILELDRATRNQVVSYIASNIASK